MAATGERVGVFGGTFDPPHLGHAIVASDLVERLALDRLLVIPAPRPPHRSVVLDADTRLRLIRKLFEGHDRVEVDDREFDRDGPSYAVHTLEELLADYPGAELFLVIGADQLAVIDEWHQHRRLVELATLVVMRRDGEAPALPVGASNLAYITVDVTRVDLSASRVRERLGEGRSIRFMVPESIRTDIERAWRERARA